MSLLSAARLARSRKHDADLIPRRNARPRISRADARDAGIARVHEVASERVAQIGVFGFAGLQTIGAGETQEGREIDPEHKIAPARASKFAHSCSLPYSDLQRSAPLIFDMPVGEESRNAITS